MGVAERQPDDLLTAVLAASRSLVSISARSIALVEDVVDLVQFRILVVIASTGACTLKQVAVALNLHVSTASRTCERLAAGGLVHRGPRASDRRHLHLTLTHDGEELVGRVMRFRRAAVAEVLDRMPAADQRRVEKAMRAFAAAAGEPSDQALWAMGWTTDTAEPSLALAEGER
jgi:DNA-binding MarR family transcriptional regulator